MEVDVGVVRCLLLEPTTGGLFLLIVEIGEKLTVGMVVPENRSCKN
jgi:hypothetical protein